MNASSCCAQGSNFNFARLIRLSSLSAFLLLTLADSNADASFLLTFDMAANKLSKSNDQAYLATGTNADPIEQYIEGVIGSNVYVYNGTKSLLAKPENVPPPQYLGNTDWNATTNQFVTHTRTTDTYLINRWNDGYDRIKINFDVAVYSIEFDWQIFPTTGTEADLTVKGDGVQYFYYNNIANKLNGKMGHTAITFTAPVRLIEFIDWTTAPIGIDNLKINYPPPPNLEVPEPATGLLALLGGLGIAVVRRRQNAAAA